MADVADPPVERKPRKSVAFSDGATIVDGDGNVTESTERNGDKDSAESHAAGRSHVEGGPSDADKEVDEVTDMFKDLAKKKKKKPKKEDADDAVAADGEFDPSALKKKKKKKVKAEDDFEAKLAEAAGDKTEAAEEAPAVQEGDMLKGTGIWQHDAVQPINYELLLNRFFNLLQSHHPDLASSGGKSYKIPPPQCLREGNKKTIFANIADIAKRLKRSDEHVTSFLFAELGTSGSVDGSRRLVIKGRFQQKQIENVLRRYIVEYVTCKTCRSPDTQLNKGENRLYFVTCNSCGSRRSVTAIKTGFSAQVGKRKRQQG
ncbi:translational initiation factor 2 beta [Aaosphaeria arxii CBS 175.79]|uniref:Translational initiation factor 2 beta n=1 Tax=Aaosphaeria arxii CBS 175.79 TaxID=1450172 RepID=A0A6A5X8J9_9PLEO|nr:translational initiation factor 2 beta [Aaosphaeria arxii CBS 175.79]KAF2009272.1 translational initiation factor 2 beta [Aaosphaeria arxii CBS 175.79]